MSGVATAALVIFVILVMVWMLIMLGDTRREIRRLNEQLADRYVEIEGLNHQVASATIRINAFVAQAEVSKEYEDIIAAQDALEEART